MQQKNIRNFSIIAHIDHGKSTLADRLLELTNTLQKREIKEQTLDSMDLEREKGITIKLKTVRMNYENYELNLIDTPGHVDFSYEVSRSLAACEGAILVVDATQGIQAQTLSNVHKALDAGLVIIPVINKIDIATSEPEKTAEALIKTFGFKKEEIIFISAKTGLNVSKLLDEVIKKIPSPTGDLDKPFRALIFDSLFDEYLGVIALVKIVDGHINQSTPVVTSNVIARNEATKQSSEAPISKKAKIKFLATNAISTFEEIGIFSPTRKKIEELKTGEVGYIATGLKEIKKVRVGDTVSFEKDFNVLALPGYKEVKPVVFASLYPIENDRYSDFREALGKLSLSDSSLSFEPESSSALGFGFRCGFLGLLHAEIVQERLEREYNLKLISSTPYVSYKVETVTGEKLDIKAPSLLPNPSLIKEILEPWILIKIFSPANFVGAIIQLCEDHRGVLKNMNYLTPENVLLEYELPLSELILNFYDDLKSISSGYASLDYEVIGYKTVDAVKLDILVHGDVVDPLSSIVVREKAQRIGREVLLKLKNVIPRHQFEVSLQAAISGKVIAREDIPAVRKNVLAKMSGGHRERKDKLLDEQKKGKERMKRLGKVDIPQQAFKVILSK